MSYGKARLITSRRFFFDFVFLVVARVTACHTVVTYDDAVGDINSAIRHRDGQDRKWRRFLVRTRRELNFRSDILGHLPIILEKGAVALENDKFEKLVPRFCRTAGALLKVPC